MKSNSDIDHYFSLPTEKQQTKDFTYWVYTTPPTLASDTENAVPAVTFLMAAILRLVLYNFSTNILWFKTAVAFHQSVPVLSIL